MFSVILESNSTDRLNGIMSADSACTLNGLQPPDLTHIIHNEASHVDSEHSMEFPRNDVFQCSLPTNAHSPLKNNQPITIFGMFNLDLVYLCINSSGVELLLFRPRQHGDKVLYKDTSQLANFQE